MNEQLGDIVRRAAVKRVLFICVRNSARSQMAEGFLNTLCGGTFVAESAGLEPGMLNPLAVTAMAEEGIDISHKGTQGVFDVFKAGRLYSHVVTVCDETSAEACPIFPGIVKRLHWSVTDPAVVEGSYETRLQAFRDARDDIRAKVEAFCGAPCPV